MKITFFSLIMLLPIMLVAQDKSSQKVFLKNKTIYKGVVKEYVPGKGIYFETSEAIYYFEDNQIDSIVGFDKSHEVNRKNLDAKILFSTEIGVIPGNSSEARTAPFSFLLTAKHNLHNGIMLGVGAGLEFWQENYMPAYLSADYLFRSSGFTPFVGLKFGYTMPVSQPDTDYGYYYGYWPQYQVEEVDPKGGLFLNPSFGFVRMLDNNYGYSVAFGYRYQSQKYLMKGNEAPTETINVAVSRLSIHVGFIFN